MVDLDRRKFLKIVGLAGATTTTVGCSPDYSRRLIPYLSPPEDVLPGEATWYATTCRECPAGCGMLARNRDGRVVKVEGNPLHPVNQGKLCPRGQASLHGLYNPDRVRQPMRKDSQGRFVSLSWEEAEAALVRSLQETLAKGQGDRIIFVTDLMTGSLRDLTALWLKELGQIQGPIFYEPFAYESLRFANQTVFGVDGVPSYHIDRADFLLSLNAGFLETWISNVEYARQFAAFRALKDGRKAPFVFVGPRLSMTAANADLWIPTPPGEEYLVALGLLRVILDENLAPTLAADRKRMLTELLAPWPMDAIQARTGVEVQVIQSVARQLASAKSPLALAEGLGLSGPNAVEAAMAANLLSSLNPNVPNVIDFSARTPYSDTARAEDLKKLSDRMNNGEIDLLLLYGANPVFSLPSSWEFRKSLESVPMVVSFSSALDETSTLAHLVLPTHTPLESWGDYSPKTGVTGLLQPVMGPMFHTRPLGDILISVGKQVKGQERFPWKDFYEVLISAWEERQKAAGPNDSPEVFWQEAVRRGGLWEGGQSGSTKPAQAAASLAGFTFPKPDSGAKRGKGLLFTTYPTIQFFDGREANRLWMQELPDPMTQITWGGWVEIALKTAEELGINKGDMLRIKSPHGTIEAPAHPIHTVPAGIIAMPIGQGHTDYGRFAQGLPANPMQLFAADIDPVSRGMLRPRLEVSVERTGKTFASAHTDGSFYHHGREVIEVVDIEEYREIMHSDHKPHIDLPLPEGRDPAKDFYPPHEHTDYRWAMVVDVDRCIGCGACVVACYAENNVAVVGREQVLKGREMSWLRAQRYFEKDRPVVHWLPMLCQHCEFAPCEAVCPIYAPHHSKEGLNNQVYNRCFGTRFCSQNDPYKVRRFNYFTYTRPEPLNWQLNPDVTVRQKGIMEKCSFCIQRITEAKMNAKKKGRKVQDGDFTTACAQTCPTDVFVFGNLLDPNSRVSQLIRDHRAYQVLGHLNTKPAVIYLKRVTQDLLTV